MSNAVVIHNIGVVSTPDLTSSDTKLRWVAMLSTPKEHERKMSRAHLLESDYKM